MNIYKMETLKTKLINDCGVKESSCKSYCSAVRAICNFWEQQGRNCKKSYQGYTKDGFFRLDKLSKPKLVLEAIDGASLNTKKTKLFAVISVLKALDYDKYKKPIEVLRKSAEDCRTKIKTDADKSLKSKKQSDHWCTLKELQDCVEYHKDIITKFQMDKTSNINKPELQKALNLYTIALCYSGKHIPPVRLECCDTEVITKKQYDKMKAEDKTGNYLILTPKQGFFSFNNYKTAKAYGENRIPLPDTLCEELRLILKLSMNNKLLFPNPSNPSKHLLKKNRFGEVLKEAFENTKKKIYSQLIRNIYITEKFDECNTAGERRQLCASMGTSLEQALGTYKKFNDKELISESSEETLLTESE